MMMVRKLFRYIDAEPFRPFRIKMANGATFPIQYPDMLAVGRTRARIWTWLDEEYDDAPESVREIAISQIETIELLPTPAHNEQNN